MLKIPISGRQLETGEIVVKISKTTFKRVTLVFPSSRKQVLNVSFEAGAESKNSEKDVGCFPLDEKFWFEFPTTTWSPTFQRSSWHPKLLAVSIIYILCHFY